MYKKKKSLGKELSLENLPTGSVATFPSVIKALAEACNFLFNK
jgi:hypothetical protein